MRTTLQARIESTAASWQKQRIKNQFGGRRRDQIAGTASYVAGSGHHGAKLRCVQRNSKLDGDIAHWRLDLGPLQTRRGTSDFPEENHVGHFKHPRHHVRHADVSFASSVRKPIFDQFLDARHFRFTDYRLSRAGRRDRVAVGQDCKQVPSHMVRNGFPGCCDGLGHVLSGGWEQCGERCALGQGLAHSAACAIIPPIAACSGRQTCLHP
mmetsp:Transcript_87143/g.281451  ORF Transcript_87143/g.281451 Transcript_87143/m.281451 type:complete len:210 (+) Transcript_87143:415-1044(+)